MSSPAAAIHPADGAALEVNLRPVAKGSWALYDFANTIFSFTVISVRDGAVARAARAVRRGDRPARCSASRSWSASGPTRSCPRSWAPCPTAAAGGCRCCSCSPLLCVGPTSLIALGGPLGGLILFTIANFAYMSALIYYDASLKLVEHARRPAAGRRASAWASGTAGRCSSGCCCSSSTSRSTCGSCSRPSCTACSRSRSSSSSRSRATPTRRRSRVGDFLASWAQLRLTIAHAREVPGLSRFLLGRFFYSDAVNTVIVVMSVVAVQGGRLHRADDGARSCCCSPSSRSSCRSCGAGCRTASGRGATLIAVLISWAVGLILGALSLGMMGTDPVTGGPVPAMPGVALFLVAGAILGLGARRRPGRPTGCSWSGCHRPSGSASSSASTASWARRRRSSASWCTALIVFLLLDSLGTGAYQVAILSLIVTMLIGLWLVWPVSDRWTGSGELHAHGSGSAPVGPPPAHWRRIARRWTTAAEPQSP